MTATSETSNKYLIVLVTEGHSTVQRTVSGDSLVVLLELYSHAFTYGGVGLLGLDTNLFNDDSSCMGRSSEWLLPLSDLMLLLVIVIGPSETVMLENQDIERHSLRLLTSLDVSSHGACVRL